LKYPAINHQKNNKTASGLFKSIERKMNQLTKIAYILVFLTVLSTSMVFPQSDIDAEAALTHHLDTLRMEKLYLHLDKAYYKAGESIWFKSYLFDGSTHLLMPGKTNVYVELINFRGNLIMKSVLKSEGGIAWGDFRISDSIADGNYLVRAYTNWMRNMDEAYFFQQQLYISNPDQKHYIRIWDLFANRSFNRRLEKQSGRVSLSFFPEGGTLIAGIPARVAWQATDNAGRMLTASGSIMDDSGRIVASLDAVERGMGIIQFVPQAHRNYMAQVHIAGRRKEVKQALPEVPPEGVSMQVAHEDDSLRVSLQLNGNPDDAIWNHLTLIAHTRGKLVVQETVDLSGYTHEILIPKHIFPSGVTQFVLIDEHAKTIAQRLVFVKEDDPVLIHLDKGSSSADGIHVDLTFQDVYGRPVSGQFSVAVTGVNGDPDKPSSDLFSFINLTSDLKGIVEGPVGYDAEKHESDSEILDIHMISNRWERFHLRNILDGQIPDMMHEHTFGIHLSGEVINPATDNPMAGHEVSLLIKDGVDQRYDVTTDSDGVFEFAGMQFHEMRTAELITDRMREGYFPRVIFFTDQDRSISFPVNAQTRPQAVTSLGSPWKPSKRKDKSPYQMTSLQDRGSSSSMYGNPSQTIYVTDNDRDNKTMLDFIVQRGSGITIQGGQVLIRGAGSMFMNNEPLFMIDGTRTNRAAFLSQSLRDVHKVDVYKGPDASIFGIHGSNGVIVSYTRRGDMYGPEGYEFRMAGFLSPNEFSPGDHIIDRSDEDQHQPTLFWDPDVRPDLSGSVSFFMKSTIDYDSYHIVVEGVDHEGRFGVARFLVPAR
jgi:hypothetical protein